MPAAPYRQDEVIIRDVPADDSDATEAYTDTSDEEAGPSDVLGEYKDHSNDIPIVSALVLLTSSSLASLASPHRGVSERRRFWGGRMVDDRLLGDGPSRCSFLSPLLLLSFLTAFLPSFLLQTRSRPS